MRINLIITALFILFGFIQTVAAQEAQNISAAQSDETVFKSNEVDQKAEIISKPSASIDHNCGISAGLATVRIIFDKSGKVTEANLIRSSGCRGFDESALKAARKIKFKPALKNNQAVSMTTVLEYQYKIY